MPQDISKLSGSAAKLLLAYLTCPEAQSVENDVWDYCGLGYVTRKRAEQELQDAGILRIVDHRHSIHLETRPSDYKAMMEKLEGQEISLVQ